jgi:tetratricopeptide (TPR) repeat protein
MTRACLVGLALLVLASAPAAAAEEGPAPAERAGAPPTALDRFLEKYRQPLTDELQGRVYEAAGDLLRAARELPEAVDLGPVAPVAPLPLPAAAEQEAEDAQEAADDSEPTPAPEPEPKLPEREPWRAVLDRPVVDDEELAHALFRAGNFEEAAAIYARLAEESPDDPHPLLMLLLCRRNAGDEEQTAILLQQARQKAPAAAEWTDWLGAMMTLAEAEPEQTE